MKILIIYAHPNTSSFNYALLNKMHMGLEVAGHTTRVKDLYTEEFDPVLHKTDLAQLRDGLTPGRIKSEQQEVLWADALIFIYPLWWYGPPAILKGWFDCVLTYGFAFEQREGKIKGLLRHKKAFVVITAGNSKDWFKQHHAEGIIVRPVTEGTLKFCGIEDVSHQLLYDTSNSSTTTMETLLDEAHGWGECFFSTNEIAPLRQAILVE